MSRTLYYHYGEGVPNYYDYHYVPGTCARVERQPLAPLGYLVHTPNHVVLTKRLFNKMRLYE